MDQIEPMPQTRLGIDDLEDIELVGSGGSAQVYRAKQVSFEREVAVKVLNNTDEQLKKRFDRERRAMGKLSNHPGIVPVYTSGTTAFDQPYLIMPYYSRGSLAEELDGSPLPWTEAVEHMATVSATMAHAHDNGVLHLDLKPGNVMLADDGTPRVSDFGIAKLLTDQTSRSATNTSFTPAYCPPEILSGQAPGKAADIYGLGATLWALVAGQPPFHTTDTSTNSIMAIMNRVAQEAPADLRDRAPDWVCAVIERAMAKNPTDRFTSAAELADALRAGPQGAAAGPVPLVAPSAQTQQVGPPPNPAMAQGLAANQDLSQQQTISAAAPAAAAAFQSSGRPDQGPSKMTFVLVALGALVLVAGLGIAALNIFGGDNNQPETATSSNSDEATESESGSPVDGQSSTTEQAGVSDGVTSTTSPIESTTTVTDPTTTVESTTSTTASTTTTSTSTTSTTEPAGDLVGTSLAGTHGITLQWISFDSPDWGAIEFEPLGDERYQVSGRQDGPDGDYVIVEGIMTKISDLELQFEGTVEVRVSYLANGEPCLRDGQMTFLSTQNRQYWRMQNFESPCDTNADYVDIFF